MGVAADPTRIDLNLDPRHRRFSGIAHHGNTPFDVPFISEIQEGLWMGGCADGLVLPEEINHVVSLYPWESYEVRHNARSMFQIFMYDSLEQSTDQVDAIARWVNAARRDGTVLVHCQAGLNRSGLVVARALILDGETPEDAIALLRERRSPAVLCNPAFETWLR